MTDIALIFDNVSRAYPRDISDMPSAILREMFFPRSLLKTPTPDSFFALRDINLRLFKGQKLGVIGAHRSGKTTLAGVASGVLQPTGGSVEAKGTRLLISRPTAGFKPTLTSIENLGMRASLAGLHGEMLDALLDKTFFRCGVGHVEARTPMGNLSPHIVKQLGLTLLLELQADILVIDEISSAGFGDARWSTRGLLKEKIDSSTALVISSDLNFIQEVAEEVMLLHRGQLYGPFSFEQAIHHFNAMPDESVDCNLSDSTYDPRHPPISSSNGSRFLHNGQSIDDDSAIYKDAVDDGDTILNPQMSMRSNNAPWKVLCIEVDGEEFRHAQLSLIRPPGITVAVVVEMVALYNQPFEGGLFVLHGGSSGLEVGKYLYSCVSTDIEAYQEHILCFDLVMPNWAEDFYGLTFCPQYKGKYFPLEHRLKILIVGAGRKHAAANDRIPYINVNSFDRKLNNASIDSSPQR